MFEFEENSLSVGLDYLPADVARKVNANICNGGGGGGSTTTAEIDPDIKKAVLPALKDVTSLYRKGGFEQLAGDEGVRAALANQQALAEQAARGLDTSELDAVNRQVAAEGLGTENLLNQLRAAEAQQMGAQQGALGSARGDRAREAAMIDRAMQLQQADVAARQQAGQGLIGSRQADLGQRQQALDAVGQIAQTGRGLDQQKLDAPISGAERYFGLLGGAPQSQSTTQKSGGK